MSSILLLMASNTTMTALTTSAAVLSAMVYTLSPNVVTSCHPSWAASTTASKPSSNPPLTVRPTSCHTSSGSNQNCSGGGWLFSVPALAAPGSVKGSAAGRSPLPAKADALGISTSPEPPRARTPRVLLELLSTLTDANRLPPACGPTAFSAISPCLPPPPPPPPPPSPTHPYASLSNPIFLAAVLTSSPPTDGSTSVVVAGLGPLSPPATRELCTGTVAPRSAASEFSCESFAKLLADGSTVAVSIQPGT